MFVQIYLSFINFLYQIETWMKVDDVCISEKQAKKFCWKNEGRGLLKIGHWSPDSLPPFP